jgi:hypothetical protein
VVSRVDLAMYSEYPIYISARQNKVFRVFPIQSQHDAFHIAVVVSFSFSIYLGLQVK